MNWCRNMVKGTAIPTERWVSMGEENDRKRQICFLFILSELRWVSVLISCSRHSRELQSFLHMWLWEAGSFHHKLGIPPSTSLEWMRVRIFVSGTEQMTLNRASHSWIKGTASVNYMGSSSPTVCHQNCSSVLGLPSYTVLSHVTTLSTWEDC